MHVMMEKNQRHLNQTQIFFNVNITTRGIVNLAFNVGFNTTMKYVKRKFAGQKNVRPDILKHVKMQKIVNFIKTIVVHTGMKKIIKYRTYWAMI